MKYTTTDAGAAIVRARDSGHFLVGKLDSQLATAKNVAAYVDDVNITPTHFVAPLNIKNVRRYGRLGAMPDVQVMDVEGYDWPGPYEPYAHQKVTANMCVLHPRNFILNEMGAGKTASVIWAADFLAKRGRLKRVLVVCPNQCVFDVWQEHLEEILTLPDVAPLVGSKKNREKQLERGVMWNVINHDGMRVFGDRLAQEDWDLVVIDECTQFKNPKRGRSKGMAVVAAKADRLWQMSGSIMASGVPTDVWHAAHMNNPRTTPSFYKFEQETMLIRRFKRKSDGKSFPKLTPKADAEVRAYRLLHPAVRYAKDSCIDLPPLTEYRLQTKLSKQQQDAMKAVRQEARLLLEEQGAELDFQAAHNLAAKALQIVSGCIYMGDERHIIGAPDRLAVTKNLIDESLSKTLVFTAFQETGNYLEEALKEYKPSRIDGTVKPKDRPGMMKRFKEDDDCRVILLHPRSAGHGLNLQVASTSIYFSPTLDPEGYVQSRERMARPGQKHKMTLVELYSIPAELASYNNSKKKLSENDAMLSLFHSMTGTKA